MATESRKPQAITRSEPMKLVGGNVAQLHRELVAHLRHFRSCEANALIARLQARGQLRVLPDAKRRRVKTATAHTPTTPGANR